MRTLDPGPITAEERGARLGRLASLLGEYALDAILLEPGPSYSYLCALPWHLSERLFALVVQANGEVFWIAPSFEVRRLGAKLARAEGGAPMGPIVGWEEDVYPWEPLRVECERRGIERLAVGPRARAFVVQELESVLGDERALSGRAVLRELRGRKTDHEIALLRRAAWITKAAIERATSELVPGATDLGLAARVRALQERAGLTETWALALFGDDAADPHGEAHGAELSRGEFVLLDTGGALHGYQSDVTRTFAFGAAPTAEQRRAFDTLRAAQRAAFEAMRPGVPCRDIDRAARAVVEGAGYGSRYSAFSHRLGHGIGTEGHEEPCLDGGEAEPLAPGMCFSNEPGIYLPGRIGIRLEDVVVVTESGAEVLGDWQEGPESARSAPEPGK